MSDIVKNALRYNTLNSKLSDPPHPHNGELDGNTSKIRLDFDCSGFVCHVLLESGYRIDYESTGMLARR